MKDTLKLKVQMNSFKNLSTGGWRLTLDLFEQDEIGILKVAALVNRQEVVEVEVKKVKD